MAASMLEFNFGQSHKAVQDGCKYARVQFWSESQSCSGWQQVCEGSVLVRVTKLFRMAASMLEFSFGQSHKAVQDGCKYARVQFWSESQSCSGWQQVCEGSVLVRVTKLFRMAASMLEFSFGQSHKAVQDGCKYARVQFWSESQSCSGWLQYARVQFLVRVTKLLRMAVSMLGFSFGQSYKAAQDGCKYVRVQFWSELQSCSGWLQVC